MQAMRFFRHADREKSALHVFGGAGCFTSWGLSAWPLVVTWTQAVAGPQVIRFGGARRKQARWEGTFPHTYAGQRCAARLCDVWCRRRRRLNGLESGA